jgi:hypothetical protein
VISNVGVMEATHNAASVKLSNNHWKAYHTIVECTQNYTVWEHFDISVSEMTTPGLAPGLRTPLTMDDFDPEYAVDIFPKRFTLWPAPWVSISGYLLKELFRREPHKQWLEDLCFDAEGLYVTNGMAMIGHATMVEAPQGRVCRIDSEHKLTWAARHDSPSARHGQPNDLYLIGRVLGDYDSLVLPLLRYMTRKLLAVGMHGTHVMAKGDWQPGLPCLGYRGHRITAPMTRTVDDEQEMLYTPGDGPPPMHEPLFNQWAEDEGLLSINSRCSGDRRWCMMPSLDESHQLRQMLAGKFLRLLETPRTVTQLIVKLRELLVMRQEQLRADPLIV